MKASCLLIWLSIYSALGQIPVRPDNVPIITSVVTSLTASPARLIISGRNLGSTEPFVSLGGTKLVIESFSATTVVAVLPSMISAGTYLLELGSDRSSKVSIALTIGSPFVIAPSSQSAPLLPLLITTVVAILGWFVVHRFNLSKDLENKRKELRLQSLVGSYHTLNRFISDGIRTDHDVQALQEAIGNVHLFGSPELVQVMTLSLDEFKSGRSAKIGPWYGALKKELRHELQLSDNSVSYGTQFGWRVKSELGNPKFESRGLRVEQLSDSYKKLLMHMSRGGSMNSEKHFGDSYDALMNIWLLGSQTEIELANTIARSGLTDGDAISQLLLEIAIDIRVEVGLPEDSAVRPVVINWRETSNETPAQSSSPLTDAG